MTDSKGRDGRKAVEGYADITRESYRTVVGRAFAARESNLRLSRDFFEKTVIEIQEQATVSRHASGELFGQNKKQGEALGELAEATMGMYEDLLDSRPQNSRN